MKQNRNAVWKSTYPYKRRRRHRHNRFYRLTRCLLPVVGILYVAVMVVNGIAAFLPDEARQIDPTAANRPAAKEPAQRAPVTTDSWKLQLVNPWNPVPEGYSIQTVTLKNGLEVDERCYPDLQAMMDACRTAGLSPIICSAYRTQAYQEKLYQAAVERRLEKGLSRESAEAEAGKVVAVPGTSEHQLGLAVDIVDESNQHLDESQERTEVQKWLMEHSWEYGFILRYPNGKSDITGIIYEPWHYRYVGREDAEQIYTQDVCLEEYLENIS